MVEGKGEDFYFYPDVAENIAGYESAEVGWECKDLKECRSLPVNQGGLLNQVPQASASCCIFMLNDQVMFSR